MAEKDINLGININSTAASGSIRQLKDEIKSLRSEMVNFDKDSPEFDKLAREAAQLTDKLDDVNDAIKKNKGEGFEAIGRQISKLGDDLLNLDFKGVKTQLVSLGTTIKANPIMLLATVVIGIGLALWEIKDKVKIVGQMFEIFGEIINDVIQYFKDLTDWMGITEFAAQDAADAQIQAANATREAVEERYDAEIILANAMGESTFEIEQEKRIAQLQTVNSAIDAYKRKTEVVYKLTDDEKKDYEKLQKDKNKLDLEFQAANLKFHYERKKELEKLIKDETANTKKNYAERIKAEETLYLLGNSFIKDEALKEKDKLIRQKTLYYDDIKNYAEEIKTNQFLKERAYYEILQLNKKIQNLTAILGKAAAYSQEIKNLETEIDLQVEKKKGLDESIKSNNINIKIAQDSIKLLNEEIKATSKKYNIQKLIISNEEKIAKFNLDKEQSDKNLLNSLKERAAKSNKEYNDFLEKEKELPLILAQNRLKVFNDSSEAAMSFTEGLFALSNRFYQDDEKAMKKRAKNQFIISKSLALAQATVTGYLSVMEAYKNGVANPIPLLGPSTGAIFATIAGVAAAANLMKIAATQYNEGGSTAMSPSVGGSSEQPRSEGISPSLTATGQQNNLTGRVQSANSNLRQEEGTNQAFRVYVLESDITNTQAKVAQLKDNSSL